MKTITVGNLKGGVSKTTTAVHVGYGLALKGVRVLLVDLDPQGHVAVLLGKNREAGLYRLIVGEESVNKVAVMARKNLYIISGDRASTDRAKRHVATEDFGESKLADALQPARFDVVIIDTAPSFDVLHISSLVASDWVLIPTRLDSLAVDGVNQILSVIKGVVARYPIDGFSVLPTFYDRTTSETADQFKMLVEAYPNNILPPIPQDTHVREASAYGQTLWEYSPNTRALQGYIEDGKRIGGYIHAISLLRERIGI